VAPGCWAPRAASVREDPSGECHVWTSGLGNLVAGVIDVDGETAYFHGSGETRSRATFFTSRSEIGFQDVAVTVGSYDGREVTVHGTSATCSNGEARTTGWYGGRTYHYSYSCSPREAALGVAAILVAKRRDGD
jgi:hypothetical protein